MLRHDINIAQSFGKKMAAEYVSSTCPSALITYSNATLLIDFSAIDSDFTLASCERFYVSHFDHGVGKIVEKCESVACV